MLQVFDTYALLCFIPDLYCKTASEYKIHLAQVAITISFYFCIALAQLTSALLEWDERAYQKENTVIGKMPAESPAGQNECPRQEKGTVTKETLEELSAGQNESPHQEENTVTEETLKESSTGQNGSQHNSSNSTATHELEAHRNKLNFRHYERILWYRYYKLYVVGYAKDIELQEKSEQSNGNNP